MEETQDQVVEEQEDQVLLAVLLVLEQQTLVEVAVETQSQEVAPISVTKSMLRIKRDAS